MPYMCNIQHHYSNEKIFQLSIIGSEISDQQLIFCLRKGKQIKLNTFCDVFLRSLKQFTDNMFVEGLRKVNFLDYEKP